MATSRSALRSENQAEVGSEAPLSAQSRTAVGAQFAHASPLTTFLASPNAPIVAALLVGSVILGPRRVIITAAVPLVRGNRSRGEEYGYALGARSVSKCTFSTEPKNPKTSA